MKLLRVGIKNFRSFSEPVELRLAPGMNALVGPNNCGKSNFLRAVGMALDPDYPFERAADVPGQRLFAFPRTTLTFHCGGKTEQEKTLLRYAEEYERSVAGVRTTYAEQGEIRFVATYRGSQSNGTIRQEYLAARGAGDRRGDGQLNAKAIRQLRKVLRFATIDTGESLTSVLNGKFRDILHGVLKEGLKREFTVATDARTRYVKELQDDLLAPLRDRLRTITCRLFPEISGVNLVPSVSAIDETLSAVEIRIEDSVDTPLQAKGMGVTGTVVIALLRYLATESRQSLIFAVEEPEAFLHPGAQEQLRDDLESLAERDDVTLLVTTHSPFILSRSDKAQVVAIGKNVDGVSDVVATAAGNQAQARTISGLFRDSTVPELLDRQAKIPSGVEAILLVEGTTDADFLRTAARTFGEESALAKIHILPTGGTDNLVAQAVLLLAEETRPVWFLVDSDENGRWAKKTLTSRFNVPKDDIVEYSKFVGGLQDAESEWLFPGKLMQAFVDEQGENLVLKSKKKIGGDFRYDFTPFGKEALPQWIHSHADATNMQLWQPLITLLKGRLGIQAERL